MKTLILLSRASLLEELSSLISISL
ncbi:hypothetical protein LINPERHAP1_LOCUS39402 [Linum perenne]